MRKLTFSLTSTVLGFTLQLLPVARAADDPYHADPAKIMGWEACNECHAPMVEAWKLTPHYETFNTMHKSTEGKAIAGKMGLRRIKDESLCLKCHYTVKDDDSGKPTAISGVSCESCHGAAKDWIKIHNDVKVPTHLADAAKLGMLLPSNYYFVAANCFTCHTVPEEKLVNVGGHKAGSDFELVSWLSGEVRHNLQKSGGKVNEEIPIERRRMLYITGRALDLEFGLRGLAKATEDGTYSKAMVERINMAKAKVEEIAKSSDLAEVKKIVEVVHADDLKPGNAAALDKAADEIRGLASGLAKSQDGSKLASVDSLIPGPDKYKGTAYKP